MPKIASGNRRKTVTGKVRVATYDWIAKTKWKTERTTSGFLCETAEFAMVHEAEFLDFCKAQNKDD